MKVALLSSDESKPYFLDELKAGIESKIADVDAEIFKVRKNLDIPKKLPSLSGFDLVMVVMLYQKETVEVKVAIERLADAEIEGVEIIKMTEHLEMEGDYLEVDADEFKNELLAKAQELLVSEIMK